VLILLLLLVYLYYRWHKKRAREQMLIALQKGSNRHKAEQEWELDQKRKLAEHKAEAEVDTELAE